jgi:hypothetical protein
VVGAFLLTGLVCAVAWWLLVDLAEFRRVGSGEAAMGELELAKRFNADGWFTVLGAVSGLVLGALLLARARDPLLTTLLLVPASGLAAATTAVLGALLGPGAPDALTGLGPGEAAPVALTVTADVAYLAWPIAALAGALTVLWAGRDGPEPAAGSARETASTHEAGSTQKAGSTHKAGPSHEAGPQRAIAAVRARVSRTRSAGATPMSKPRRPPET